MRVGGSCAYCGRALKLDEAHLDHEAGSAVAEHAPDHELHCTCGDCRAEKGERTAAEYRHLRRARQAYEMLATLSAR